MKVLITGGHVTPALAVIDEIKKSYPNVEIVFVGRKFASVDDTETTFEYKEVTKRNIHFIPLSAGRFTRIASISSFKELTKVPTGYVDAVNILKQEKPDTILSFGGYIALPVAIAGYFLKIPVYTHEQTAIPGLSNKTISLFARNIFLSFPESEKYFNKAKVILTGNPIRKEVFNVHEKPFKIPSGKKVLYITGGSLGAHSINIHIEKILPQLLHTYVVIHQTGNVKEYNDFDRLSSLRDSLPSHLGENYILRAHFSTDEVGYIYNHADLIVSRSGANTFFELAALKKPALFIPLPWSANGEQEKHAEIFKEYGVGEIFDQAKRSQELFVLINNIIANIDHYRSNFAKFPTYYTQDAAQTITQFICKD